MVWSSLGTKRPDFNWDPFTASPITGDALIRCSQTYHPSEISFLNRLQLSEVYSLAGEAGYHFLRSIRPSTQARLISLVVPPAFRQAGLLTRTLQVRHNYYGVSALANWDITLELWIPDEDADRPSTDEALASQAALLELIRELQY